ncbi:MAG: hypothetical protein QXL15_01105 [Candidatus Korarchaeota archaeon]
MVVEMDIEDLVASWLDMAKIKYSRRDDVIITKWKTNYFSNLTVHIFFSEEKKWLYIVAWLLPHTDLSHQKVSALLHLNWRKNGIKIGTDDEGDIVVSAELLRETLTMNVVVQYINNLVSTCDEVHKLLSETP